MQLLNILACSVLILGLAIPSRAAEVRHFWDFEGANTFEDKVGAAHGSVSPATTVTTDLGQGDNGTSMRVQDEVGLDDIVAIDSSQLAQPGTSSFSMSYWFNLDDDSFDDPRGIFDFSGNGGDGVQSLFIDRGGNADNLAFRVDGIGGAALALVPMDLEDANWHFVAATYDAGGTLNVHVDGLGVDASASTSSVGTVQLDVDSFLGSFNYNPEVEPEYKGLFGRLDDIAFYDGLLTNQEIEGLFDGSLSPVDIGGGGDIDPDFDDNGLLDCGDIDQLVAEIAGGMNNAAFDLTGDGFVDLMDRDAWLERAGDANLPSGSSYLIADANLDGVIDVSDFNAWNANKFSATAEWCSGDFNADGLVDVSDFNEWNARKFTSSDTAVVPEPAGWLVSIFGVLGLLQSYRVRSTCR